MKIIQIKTDNSEDIKPIAQKLYIPPADSHKGQNGRVLIIGGSKLFHQAPIWAAQAAASFVDIVHFSSTDENNKIISQIKKNFHSGIVVSQNQLDEYIQEDDALLIGSGMVRTEEKLKPKENYNLKNIEELREIENEGIQTYYLTKYLLNKYPEKKWVIDAGALQMMDKQWLRELKTTPILTPHQQEFKRLFDKDISQLSILQKAKEIAQFANDYNCVILLKSVYDIVSDGECTYVIEGGNPGLTKGGTGDILAGLCCGLYAKNDSLTAATLASYLLKKGGDELFKELGYWYNIDDIIHQIARILTRVRLLG